MRKIYTFLFLLSFGFIQAQTRTSIASTAWNVPTTWDCNCIPAAGENVVIASGTTVLLTTNQTINHVTLIGNLNLNTNTRTLTVNGNFTATNTSTIFGGAASRDINVNGNFVVSAGANLTITAIDFLTNGTTDIFGSVSYTSNTGVKTYVSPVTIHPGGVFASTLITTKTNMLFRNGIVNNGTFNAGALRFVTNNQSLSGNAAMNFTRDFDIVGAITLTNNNTNIVSIAGQMNGTVATSTFVAGNGSNVQYSDATRPMVTGVLNAGTATNTFDYTRLGNQDIKTATYYNLNAYGSGDRSYNGAGTLSVNNDFIVENSIANLNCSGVNTSINGTFTLKTNYIHTEGTATTHQMANFVLDGGYLDLGNGTLDGFLITNNFTVTANGGTIDSPGDMVTGFTVQGFTNINGAFIYQNNNASGIIDFKSLVTINPAASWTSTGITDSVVLNFENGIVNNGTFNAGGATFKTNNQTVTGNTLNFVSVSVNSIEVENHTTVYMSSTNDCLTGSGTWEQMPNSSLFLQGDATVSTFQASVNQNTVTYYGTKANQNLNPGVYYHLVVNKGTGDYATLGVAYNGTATINGSLTIQSGNLQLDTPADVLTVSPGATTLITGSNAVLFFSDASAVANLSDLTLTADGTINGNANGNAFATTLTTTGTGGTLQRCNFTVTGLTTLNANLTLNNNNGIKSFEGLVDILPGVTWNSTSITTVGNLIFKGGIANNGISFTSAPATFNTNNQSLTGSTAYLFNGTVTVTGIQLNNFSNVDCASTAVSLSGTGSWVQQPNSFLFIAGDATSASIASNASPNTVTYYAGVVQDVNPGVYHHLVINKTGTTVAQIAGAGAGTIQVNGTLSVLSGELQFNTAGDAIVVNAGGNTLITGSNSIIDFNAVGTADFKDLTLSNGARLHDNGAATGTMTASTLTVSGTGSNIINRGDLTVTGVTSINGNLTLNFNTGVKIFNDLVTVNASGTWTSTAVTTAGNLIFRNSIINNNTFSAGGATFNTNNQSISGNAFSFTSVVVTGFHLTNMTTANITTGLSGTGRWIQNTNAILNFSGVTITIVEMDATANNNTVVYLGGGQNIYHPINGEYFHLTIRNNGTKTASAGTKTILGDFSLANIAVFNVSTNNVDLIIKGNWLNSSTATDPFTEGTRTVTFSGTNQQTISNTGDQQGTDFYNVVVNNTSSTGIILAGTNGRNTIIVNGGLLTLTDGYIYSSANNMLVVNNGGNATGGSALSFVHGPMRKTGNQAFIFPTGEDVAPVGFGPEDVWARIGISNPTNTTTQFTAQYFYSYYGSMAKDVTLTHVSFHEYWILNRASLPPTL